MNQATQPKPGNGDAERSADHMTEEADIGSGEKTPAERETDEQIKTVPSKPAGKAPA
ncbi:hypothetical protein [Massilia sp. Root418]|jgi:hypothetical protein|uniref:hypothetical protein n=1 Tax=Massilia sp. Root418 TaxID=1736532 RepID=UPI000ADF7B84|nr:hypothetical protein [Massilia sp. Root418]